MCQPNVFKTRRKQTEFFVGKTMLVGKLTGCYDGRQIYQQNCQSIEKSRVNPQTEWLKVHLEDCPSSITWIDVDFNCFSFLDIVFEALRT